MNGLYDISAQVWLYPGKAAWHFVTIPTEIAKEIDFRYAHEKQGWGSLPVEVTVGQTTWTTSIFPDKKSDSYLLPLKSEVRKKEAFQAGDEIQFTLKILK